MSQDTAQIRKVQDKEGTQFFPITHVDAVIDGNGDAVSTLLAGKQATLVSGTNIKTINNESLLGSGNINVSGGGGGTVTSVAMTVPTGLSVSGSPITTSGTLAVSLASGYSIPTTTKQSEWDGKADKVSSATNGNFAGLNASGNLTDSGKKWSDFILRADINGEDAAKCAAFYDGPNDNSFALPGSDAAPDCDYIIEVANNKVSSWSSTTNNDHYPSEKLVKDSLDAKQPTLVSGTNIKTINNNSLLGSGNVSVGTYSKPSGGIPATDLASAVQTSLGKADTALQSYTETDPTVPSWAKAANKPSYTLDEVSDGSTRSLANYLPLSGGILSSTNQRILTINHTGNDNNAYFSIRFADVEKAALGYDTLSGLWMKNVASASGAFINIDDSGIFKYKNLYTIYHSGNFIAGTDYVSISEAETITGAKKFTGGITSSGISISATNPTLIFRNSGGLFGRLYMNAANGSFYRINSDWSAQYTVYDSGNSNKSDVAWTCSSLTGRGLMNIEGLTDGTNDILARFNTGRSRVNICYGTGHGITVSSIRSSNGYTLLELLAGTAADGTGGSSVFRVRADGTAGFNTNAPTQAVHVVGNILATGTITPGSDSRIKSNQKEITTEDAFFIIENLQPKTWVWNEKADKRLKDKGAAGLVAQDVKEILPDAVTISENGDIKDFHSLNYNTIQGYEIAAIKGLIEEVKSLKAEIAELKKQIK